MKLQVKTIQEFKKSMRYEKVMQRSGFGEGNVLSTVQSIMDDVRDRGDVAIDEYAEMFDGVRVTNLLVSTQAIQDAYTKVDQSIIEALQTAAQNITAVHKAQLPDNDPATVVMPGVEVWRKYIAIETVGLYVPGGRAVYPSSVLMTAIPAKLAGCKRVVITTPPQPDGTIAPALLVAADIAGIEEIYTVGGAQAIAALVYGTKSIPKVSKIFGPGNSYVATAKLLAYSTGDVAIDSPAGPSEVLVIADDTASAEYIAADIMCDTEHGDDSAGIVITTSKELAQEVLQEIKKTYTQFPTADRIKKSLENYGAIVVVDTIEQAVQLANEYAAEHTLVQVRNATVIAKKIVNAGSVFIGNYSCKAAGDYATGSNHVLPTGGAAKMFSALSVLDFMKLIEYQLVSRDGLKELRPTIETLATVEQLPAHAYSSAVRFNK